MEQVEQFSAANSDPFCNGAGLVPSTEDLRAAYSGPDVILEPGVVTVMMRHLPRTYTFKEVKAEIDAVVPSCAYNYIHLPWDCKRGSNINYVFVNFTSPDWASRTFLLLSGKSWSFVQCTKVCRIAAAILQGLGTNLANYVLNSRLLIGNPNDPAVFTCDRRRMDLQLAVKTFCTPEDFYMARMQSLKKLEEAAALAPGTQAAQVSSKANNTDWMQQSEIMTEPMIESEDCELPRGMMMMQDEEHEHVVMYGCSNSISSSCSASTQNKGSQRDTQNLQTCASPDSTSAGYTTPDKIVFFQSLSYQANCPASTSTSSPWQTRDVEQKLNFSGQEAVPEQPSLRTLSASCFNSQLTSTHYQSEDSDNSSIMSSSSSSPRTLREPSTGLQLDQLSQGSKPVLAGDAWGKGQNVSELIVTTRTRRHNSTLNMLKAAGILSHEFVQKAVDPGATVDGQNIWYVPSPASSGSSPLDNDAKKLLDSIKFEAVDLRIN